MKDTYSQPIIAIVGPTAIGKTSISIDVAKRINGEIIGLDSRQIYKGMSIGTAQPSKKELKLIPHHLIGIKDPNFIISSGEYANLVVNAVSDIIERNKEPIICGGAGLYYRAISKGIFTGSKTDLNIRSLLNDQYEKLGAEKLFSKLEEIDPVYSKKVHLNNKKRLIRALEIYMTTGKSPSVHFDSQKKRTTSLLNLFTVLLTVDKKKLCEKIEKRTNMMINNGWVEETKKLISNRKKLNFHPIDSIGYKQIISFLNGDISESELENEIIVKTTQYAKNQIKWFRKEKIDLEINLDMESNSIVKKIIETFFNVKSAFIKN
ncbi:MAG: tRNA (adenosine(37)-N6)-dimethylallyltransferase MiaA [Candidatus Marinimicrobia bacterium]|nr:tRNA (adenosine(37)-N6)-dimethylallyltransferase MiaA [Candidatus Neomarinimicrobiota bacterium]